MRRKGRGEKRQRGEEVWAEQEGLNMIDEYKMVNFRKDLFVYSKPTAEPHHITSNLFQGTSLGLLLK